MASPSGAPDSDPLRQGLLRYVAFTSDVGEAFKPFIARRLYLGSYAVVAAYGLLDVADKGRRAYAAEAAATASTSGRFAAGPTRLPATAAAAAAAVAGAPALAPELQPLRGVSPASASRALAHTAAGVAAACSACLPPRAAYAAAAASIHEQRPSTAPVAAAVLDTALWHGAASLALPMVLINRTVWATRQLLSSASFARLPARVRTLAPSAAGLALIPLVVPHIDEAVTQLMDAHKRPRQPQPGAPRAPAPAE